MVSGRFSAFWLRASSPRAGVVLSAGAALAMAMLGVASIEPVVPGRALGEPAGLPSQSRSPSTALSSSAGTPAPVSRSLVLSNEEWMNDIKSDTYWRGRNRGKSGGSSETAPMVKPMVKPMGLGVYGTPADSSRWQSEDDWGSGAFGRGTYRTMCVRLCDGYHFPVSFSTTPDRFADDDAQCQASCGGSQARLFVYPNPGGEIDDMRDLQGRAYRRLPSAFLFRTTYDAACKCKAHPWEAEAVALHRGYAANNTKPSRPQKRASRERSKPVRAASIAPATLVPVVRDMNDPRAVSPAADSRRATTVRTFSGAQVSLVVVNGPKAAPKPVARTKADAPPLPVRNTADEGSRFRPASAVPRLMRLGGPEAQPVGRAATRAALPRSKPRKVRRSQVD